MTSFARAIACLLAVMAGFLGGTALAHTDLVRSTPADGAALDTRPTELTFEFAEPLLPDFVRFVAADPAGQTTELAVTRIDAGTAVVAWPAEAAPGPWTVEYRVVSEDGHPVTGSISFRYDAPTPAPTSTSAQPLPTTSSAAAPSSTTIAPTSAAPASSAAASPSPSVEPTTNESSSLGWILAGLAVFALAAVAIAGLIARHRAQ